MPRLPFLAALVALACAALTAQASAATFEWAADCPSKPEAVKALDDADCGWLTVPENRADPDGREIELPVAILRSRADRPQPDPIVYMEGGPGGPALPTASVLIRAGLTATREVIVMGQRGTAYAKPALTCPEVDRFNVTGTDLPYDDAATGRRLADAHEDCYRRLKAKGIDLGAYDTTANAADFADLLVALRALPARTSGSRIERWNVLGVSYGTDLALTYLRDHPEGVRSVTIDSVVPPDRASLSLNWANAGMGLGNVMRACREQDACNRRYPNLRDTFSGLVRTFENAPLKGTVDRDGRAIDVVLDGGGFANLAFGLTEGAAPELPRLFEGLQRRDRDVQREVLESYAEMRAAHAGVFSWGLHNGVVCSEWVPYEPSAEVGEVGRRWFPHLPAAVLSQAPQFPFMDEICSGWKVPRAPRSQRDVTRSGVPALVISGSYDALTAPDVAADAAAPLTRGNLIVIRGSGHFVLRDSACAQRIAADFLDDLDRFDGGCARALRPPPFTIAKR